MSELMEKDLLIQLVLVNVINVNTLVYERYSSLCNIDSTIISNITLASTQYLWHDILQLDLTFCNKKIPTSLTHWPQKNFLFVQLKEHSLHN